MTRNASQSQTGKLLSVRPDLAKISPLWRDAITLWQFRKGSFKIGQHFELTLAYFTGVGQMFNVAYGQLFNLYTD